MTCCSQCGKPAAKFYLWQNALAQSHVWTDTRCPCCARHLISPIGWREISRDEFVCWEVHES